MGLFSSKSKSSSSTSYSDSSTNTNLEVDLSGGDLTSGASKNIVAGGNVNVDGLSEDLATQIFGVVQTAYGDAYSGAKDWVTDALYNQKDALHKSQSETLNALQTAYNSEQATISSFKTYALYALIGFVAWAYFGRKN